MARRVSIKDVAREAGVSVTTVSHALNDKGRLNSETRRRVREVASELGYRPNPAARSLVSGRTGLIAAMASLPAEPRVAFTEIGYYNELIGAATGVAVAHDYALVIAPLGAGAFVWDRVPLDGVIVIGPMLGDPALPVLRERGVPFVTVRRDPDGGGANDPVVTIDDVAATLRALDHLAEGGARRVALLTIPPLFSLATDVLDGYRRWSHERDQELAIETISLDDIIGDLHGTAARAVERLMSLPDAPDALYCPLEQLGVSAADALIARGYKIPQDVMIVTTNDVGEAERFDPPLTTVEADHRELGRRACDLLMRVIDGTASLPVVEVVGSELFPRVSTER
jgi:DNA-binding LacI/PurR family transcriptional regulator